MEGGIGWSHEARGMANGWKGKRLIGGWVDRFETFAKQGSQFS